VYTGLDYDGVDCGWLNGRRLLAAIYSHGGSGSYQFSLTGSLPAGLSFAGNTLSGTPTEAGLSQSP